MPSEPPPTHEAEPLVTIICITYNHAALIGRALESFVSQKTDFTFQVFVADDCSTDGAQDVIRRFAQQYPDIVKPILRKKNVGPEENFLCTAELACSKYVAICDGDDYFIDVQKLQKQVDVLERDTTLSICYGYGKEVWADGSHEPKLTPPRGSNSSKSRITLDDLVRGTPRTTSTVMYRWRFQSVPIRDHMAINIQPGDTYLMLLHAEVGDAFFLEDVLSVYWRHSSGIWYDRENAVEEHLLAHGMSELFFHYYVYRRFVGPETKEEFKMRTTNAFSGMLGALVKHGKIEELMQLTELGDEFFSEFGGTVTVEQSFARPRRRRRRKRNALAVLCTLFVGMALFGWLASGA